MLRDYFSALKESRISFDAMCASRALILLFSRIFHCPAIPAIGLLVIIIRARLASDSPRKNMVPSSSVMKY